MGKSNRIQSSHVRFGRRTFFFDIHQASNNKKFLRVTESQFMGENKEREYNSFILFPEDITEFKKNMDEAINALV